MSIWVNIDIPSKTFGINYTDLSGDLTFKGINQILRDGGWLQFSTYGEAFDLYTKKYPDYTLVDKRK
ncbi:hypothetical protein [Peribacillus sp. SCS-155]|uniref:hypothetical protein n=1 Tax=Peribacillus sedimenti TaxID=3115297 RepID=UPI0039059EF8